MCGRYTLHTSVPRLARQFGVDPAVEPGPRFNIAPSQEAPVVRRSSWGRELVFLRWGLLPSWAHEERPRFSMVNARAETLAHKPAYRQAFRHRRCLIPANARDSTDVIAPLLRHAHSRSSPYRRWISSATSTATPAIRTWSCFSTATSGCCWRSCSTYSARRTHGSGGSSTKRSYPACWPNRSGAGGCGWRS